MKKIPLILFITSILTSCYNDNEEAMYPKLNSTCDTANITYSKHIKPILDANCMNCHGQSVYKANGGNTNLEGYTNVVNNADIINACVNHEPSVSPMPDGGGKLDNCSLSQIQKWIDNGTKQ